MQWCWRFLWSIWVLMLHLMTREMALCLSDSRQASSFFVVVGGHLLGTMRPHRSKRAPETKAKRAPSTRANGILLRGAPLGRLATGRARCKVGQSGIIAQTSVCFSRLLFLLLLFSPLYLTHTHTYTHTLAPTSERERDSVISCAQSNRRSVCWFGQFVCGPHARERQHNEQTLPRLFANRPLFATSLGRLSSQTRAELLDKLSRTVRIELPCGRWAKTSSIRPVWSGPKETNIRWKHGRQLFDLGSDGAKLSALLDGCQ